MAEIKSSLEIALEKASRLGSIDKTEVEREKNLDIGRRIAASYLGNKETSLADAFKGFSPQTLQVVIEGAMEVLTRNLTLPRDKMQWDAIDRAMHGVFQLKGSPAKGLLDYIREHLKSYENTKSQYLQQVKAQFQAKLSGMQQAVAKQYGMGMAANLDVEMLPEFQNEWTKIASEIDTHFRTQLDQAKEQLKCL